MDTLDAAIREIEGKHYLLIDTGRDEVQIPLSDDGPGDVKKAFNKLILRIKEGAFRIQLKERGEDLFSEVAAEYLRQLNEEIREVRKEMEKHGLV